MTSSDAKHQRKEHEVPNPVQSDKQFERREEIMNQRRTILHYGVGAGLSFMFAGLNELRDARASIQSEIVGGKVVPLGRYPFAVALLDMRAGKTTARRQFCGGALISDRHVLSAGHCSEGWNRHHGNLQVQIGTTKLNKKKKQNGVIRKVADVIRQPKFDSDTLSHDIAIFTLSEPVDTDQFTPLKIAGPESAYLLSEGTPMTVIGWGGLHQVTKKGRDKKQRYSKVLREGQVFIMSDEACDDMYGDKIKIRWGFAFCARAQGVDACQGDSGGVTFVEVNGEPVGVGVVSDGKNCADHRFPGDYADLTVKDMAAFIQKTTGIDFWEPATA